MHFNRVSLITAASALACMLLILFQVQWMQQSRRLIEEEFENRVNTALCSAISRLAEAGYCASGSALCRPAGGACVLDSEHLQALLRQGRLESELHRALEFNNISLPYEFDIVPKDEVAPSGKGAVYQCSLAPLLSADSHQLKVIFPRKIDYVLQRMGFVIGSSLFILLFITLVFGLASYSLHRQRRITQHNIDFFNNMAHEFRTPLTNISLAARMLGRKQPDLAVNPLLDIIHQESRQLNTQLERLLDLSRLEEHPVQLAREEVNLNRTVRQVLASMDPQISRCQGQVTVTCRTAGDPVVRGDAFHLGNALRNLLDNSLKYREGPPVIGIEIGETGREVTVCIRDNGIGISPADHATVFRKFHHGGGDLYREKGFGLGLAYVKSIVDGHRGSIRLESEPGRGASFTLHLPKS